MNKLGKQRKVKLEYEFLTWFENRFPGRKSFDDPDVLDNPDCIHYYPTEIKPLSPFDGEDFLESRYALEGDFLRLEINRSAPAGKRVRITCTSANTEWLLNKTSYEDYDEYERLREMLKNEGWHEDENHHWRRPLDWFEQFSADAIQDMFDEIKLNILETWGNDNEQPLVKVRMFPTEDLGEHIIMLCRQVACYYHESNNGTTWHWFHYIDDDTRESGDLPEDVETEDEAFEYLRELFPEKEIVPFEYEEKFDYSQPATKDTRQQDDK